MKDKSIIDWIAYILVVVGAINWGLVALASVDLVFILFGTIKTLATIVYMLVAISGIWVLVKLFK